MRLRLFCTFVLLLSYGSSAWGLCTQQDKVKLYAKEGGKGKISWVVGKHTPLLQVDRKGAWIQVSDVDNSRHWVHARYVTTKVDCAMIRSKKANLRLGPGSEYHLTDLGVVKKYATFKKLGRDEAWLKLQDPYGQIHWAHENTLWEPRSVTRVRF